MLASETRPSLSAMKWRPNLKRVMPPVIPVIAASGPPIRIPSISVKRKRLPTRARDHGPSNMGRPQHRARQISRTSLRPPKTPAARPGHNSVLGMDPKWLRPRYTRQSRQPKKENNVDNYGVRRHHHRRKNRKVAKAANAANHSAAMDRRADGGRVRTAKPVSPETSTLL